MTLRTLIAIGILECCWLLAPAQAAGVLQANTSQPSLPPKKAAAVIQLSHGDAGEQKFQQHCSRCHNAPQQLTRRISGTVMMHMRARASLSAADERAILHYLAP